MASIWKWGCFRLRNAGTTARAGAGGEGVFFSRWRPIYFIRFIWNGPIHVLLHKYSNSNIFFDASNADKSCKYMKQFESYDFKIKEWKNQQETGRRSSTRTKWNTETVQKTRSFGQLESALYDRCSYFKTMDIVQYDLFPCK